MNRYIDEHKDDTFASVYGALVKMIQRNPDQAEQQIRGILRNLYINQGLDWTGRGAACNAGIEASIAAHECILLELRDRHQNGDEK
ncbi:MAG: hypothetical protein HXX11_20855 [Desulfuromonadales bacterium]|nr:hypothetical protein [Desulfuromonadales bacterium]